MLVGGIDLGSYKPSEGMHVCTQSLSRVWCMASDKNQEPMLWFRE